MVSAGLDWRAVEVLRAYVASRQPDRRRRAADPHRSAERESRLRPRALDAVRRQVRSQRLGAAGEGAPARAGGRRRGARCANSIAAVPALIHDRLLRASARAVAATVRTNVYAAAPGAPVALKLDLTQLPPSAAPATIETWVHGVGLHGVHLRAGRVARGGIRSSDRPDDFRAEILGLMRTQVVKNAVIVPVGAKGGFVITERARARSRDPARVEAAYRAFIDALLSITDKLEHGAPWPRRGSSSTTSPIRISSSPPTRAPRRSPTSPTRSPARARFWLGDAFASGGSHGYDHKRARHHRARRVGVRAPALPRAGARSRSRRRVASSASAT